MHRGQDAVVHRQCSIGGTDPELCHAPLNEQKVRRQCTMGEASELHWDFRVQVRMRVVGVRVQVGVGVGRVV
jgi:hypothetical protein